MGKYYWSDRFANASIARAQRGLENDMRLQRELDAANKRIAELEAAARTLVQNAEFDGDISTVDTEDIKILKELLA